MTFWIFLLALRLHAESNVIAFKIPPSRQSCARALEAEIIEFPAARPPFQDSQSFLQAMRGTRGARYYFYQRKDAQPFREARRKAWTAQPDFPESDDLYAIAALPRGGTAPELLSYLELRARFEVIAFTKIRTPPLIRLVAQMIKRARHLEHHIADRPVADPQLDFSELLSNAPPTIRAMRLVDSWRTINAYEDSLQRLLKEVLRESPHAEARELADKLLPRLREIYRNAPFVSEILLSVLDET